MIKEKLKNTIAFLKIEIKCMSDEERMELVEELTEGYCDHCGSSHLPCYCTRDD